ncbi:MAG: ATP synthase F1 subunit gamma [Lachnospiraceae bacterium]|nr:ATP synthase F1 subunit gamma [Lachnospiraceae bacterium]
MAGLREIQSRIKSIQDTRKITNAMYMISSTKMKKAKQALEATEPYFYTLQSTIARILRHLPEMEHMYFEKPEVKRTRIGLLVITGDKGLAGAYNHNILNLAQKFLDNTENHVKLFIVGELGRQYFTSRHIPIEENFRYTVQSPNFNRARWISEKILEQYQNGELDEIHVIYTRMENSMQSVPEDERLLPIRRPCLAHIPADVYQEEFFMIPSPEEAVDTIIPNYITGFIYGALVQAFYTVHNARMIAMEAATNNADELLRDLKVMYNRARQAAITQEITEVCSGAKAQRAKKDAQK